MSLLWRDQVRIVLCPDRLVVVRFARGFGTRVVARGVLPVDAASPDWKQALSILRSMLKQNIRQSGEAVVVLSSRFVQHQLLPWSDTILSEPERHALARHVYRQTYGESSDSLELRISEGGFGAASVVSGVESEFVSGIREAFKSSSLKLVSIQPFLMNAFNRWHATLRRDAQWFVLAESGTLCMALLCKGRWQCLRMMQRTENWFEELQLALHREGMANDMAEKVRKVSICLFDDPEATIPDVPEWSFNVLQFSSAPSVPPEKRAKYAMALAGVL